MTRGKFILTIITICAILGFGVYYAYKKYATNTHTNNPASGIKDFTLFDSIFPSTNTNSQNNGTTTNNTTTAVPLVSTLHQISYRPIAGYGLFTKGVERLVSDALVNGKPKTTTDYTPTVRYVDQQTGIVYEQDNKHTENRISNTTIPNTYEALFSNDGTHVVYRFLDKDQQTILTYIAELIQKTNTPTDLTGSFTYQNIKNIALSPDGLSYIYLRPKTVGVDVVSTLFTSKKEVVLFSSPITEWVINVINKSIILTTKPSGLFNGYSYTIEKTSGVYSKTLSGNGLTQTTTPDGLYKIYSLVKNNIPSLYIFNTTNNSTFNTGLVTLSEKCTYSVNMYYCAVPTSTPTGTYPDSWYQGVVTFSDDLWSINPKDQKLTFIEHLKTSTDGIDAINLQTNKEGKILYFVDKKTNLLWAYDL